MFFFFKVRGLVDRYVCLQYCLPSTTLSLSLLSLSALSLTRQALSTAKAKAEKEHSVWLARRRQDSRDRAHASKAVREERQQADAARLALEIEDHRVQHDEREQYVSVSAE